MSFSLSVLESVVVGAIDVVLAVTPEGPRRVKLKAAQNYASTMLTGTQVIQAREYLNARPKLVQDLIAHNRDAVMLFAESAEEDDKGLVAELLALLREVTPAVAGKVFDELDPLWESE